MAREFAKAFYNRTAWRKCRAAYIAERQAVDGGMCEVCQEEPGYIVHHKTWLSPENINNPEISLNHDNLMYVGLVCHNRIDQDGEQDRCVFDASGQPVPLPP